MVKWKILGASLAVASSLASAGAAGAAEFYEGKTITFIVGYSPGGSTDTTWRTVAPFIAKHIPGNPTVVVKNMAGGGGTKATNFVFEKARPDGLTLLSSPWNPLGALIGAPGLRADYTKFEFIGGIPETITCYVRTGVMAGGLKDRTDIVKLKSIKLGGLTPDSRLDILGRLSLGLLGLDVKYVPGYRGGAKRKAAVLSGEIDVSTTGITEYKTAIEPGPMKDGQVMGLYYHPSIKADGTVIKDPVFTELPDFVSFYKKAKGTAPSGKMWELLKFVYSFGGFTQALNAPPGTPKAAVDALRKGFEGLAKDPDYEALVKKQLGTTVPLVQAAEGEDIIKTALGGPDPKLVAELKAFAQAGAK